MPMNGWGTRRWIIMISEVIPRDQKKNDHCEMESGAEGYESLCQGNFD